MIAALSFAVLVLAGDTQAASPTAAPQIATASVEPAPAALASGVEIAKLLNPENEVLEGSRAAIVATLQKMFAADPNVTTMEKEHPGFIAAGSEAIQSTTLAILKERLPILWSRLGAAYARSLSEAELGQTLRFYQSEAGKRLIQATLKGIDPSALIQKQIAAPDRKVEAAELGATVTASATKAATNATSEDRTALYNFVFTPLGLKIRQLNPELLKIGADWSNERDEISEERVTEAVGAALAPFLADTAAKKAKP